MMDTTNTAPRRRRICSVVPPNFSEDAKMQQLKQSIRSSSTTSRCCDNLPDDSAVNSPKELSNSASKFDRNSSLRRSCQDNCSPSHSRVGSDNLTPKEIRSVRQSCENRAVCRSPVCVLGLHKQKRSEINRPTRKTQRSMSAHSAAVPGPDSAILRDPLTGKIYKRGKLLGKGGFAKVYEGVELSTGKKYALKIIDKTKISLPPQREKVDAEIDLHAAASESGHPNVAKFEGSFENSRVICLVLELCSKRSLAHYFRREECLRESEVSDIVWQIVCGLAHIHGCGLLHRDLKLGNILLSDNSTVKIADFGLATRTAWGKRRTICGTPNFIAPEVLHKQGHGPEADLWSVGCILFTLLVGKPPFESGSFKETYKCIVKNSYTIPNNVSEEAADLVRWLLQSKPQSRPTLAEVLDHAFFKKNDTSSRFAGIDELAKQFPHREIVSAPVIPLRRRSALPRVKSHGQSSESGSYPSEPCQLRHGNFLSDPCLVTSSAKLSDKNQQSYNPTDAISENVESVSVAYQAETKELTTAQVTTVIETADHVANSLKETESYKENNSKLIRDDKNSYCNKTKNSSQEVPQKRGKASPMKLLASKLQKLKIPSPKKCLKAVSQKSKTTNEQVNVSVRSETTVKDSRETTWITKWVDYSNKYGFGYQLATGDIGVLFNDGSHIMLLSDGCTVEYVNDDGSGGSRVFPISEPPQGCLRIVNILRLFINYMNRNLEAHGRQNTPIRDTQSTVRMLTWARTTNHIMMYLSNGTLQVNFCDDHAKVNVSNIHKKSSMTLSYINKNKETYVYENDRLASITDQELRYRLQQVHEEFHFLLGEPECVSHPFCSFFREASAVDASPKYSDALIGVVAAQ